MDWQHVPHTWSSSRQTPVAETVIRSSDDARRCVGWSESARADVGGELTVVCQVRRCLAGQTLKDQDGDLEGHSLTCGCGYIVYWMFCACNFVCLFACLFVRLRISPPKIKIAASNFVTGVQGKESHILGNFAPHKPKIGRRIGQRAHWPITEELT